MIENPRRKNRVEFIVKKFFVKGLGARVEPKGRYTKEPQERKHTSGFNVNKQVERCDYRMG